MDRDPEGKQEMSLRLARVLSDIGVNRQMVTRRRKTFLSKEKTDNVWNNIRNHTHNRSYYFGSQSEGTTTLDMNSDVDQLNCFNQCNVMLDETDWKQDKLNLLMIKNERSPPQHCCLQMFRSDRPLPCINVPPEIHVERDIDGRVILTNTWIDTLYKQMFGRYFIKQGPSRSMMKEMDIVNAVYCKTTPPECRTLFSRPKPGHWPRPDILVRSSQYGIFLVPQGHAESDQSNLEWRFSTAQIERLLMFDLCIVKVQAYTFLKVLRKTFFKPLVGDRLSTFHFKTALLFTVETHPPNIWQENNLLQCVVYCLKTLQRWFKLRFCPHYTISGVDLFVGKLRKWEFPLLSTVLTDMIDNIMNFVCKIEMDQIGDRVGGRFIAVSTRHQYALLLSTSFYKFAGQNYYTTKEKKDIFQIRNLVTKALEIPLPSLITVEIMHSIKFLYQLLASLSASLSASIYLQQNQPIPSNIYFLYEASLDSDLTSSRLKLASMLYCSGQYERASLVLAHTEELLQADVLQWCPCARETNQVPTEKFIQRVLELPEHEIICHMQRLFQFVRNKLYASVPSI